MRKSTRVPPHVSADVPEGARGIGWLPCLLAPGLDGRPRGFDRLAGLEGRALTVTLVRCWIESSVYSNPPYSLACHTGREGRHTVPDWISSKRVAVVVGRELTTLRDGCNVKYVFPRMDVWSSGKPVLVWGCIPDSISHVLDRIKDECLLVVQLLMLSTRRRVV